MHYILHCTYILPRPFLQIFTQRLLLIRFFILWPYFSVQLRTVDLVTEFLANSLPMNRFTVHCFCVFIYFSSSIHSFISFTQRALLHYISTNLLFSALCLQRPCTKHFSTIHRNFFPGPTASSAAASSSFSFDISTIWTIAQTCTLKRIHLQQFVKIYGDRWENKFLDFYSHSHSFLFPFSFTPV